MRYPHISKLVLAALLLVGNGCSVPPSPTSRNSPGENQFSNVRFDVSAEEVHGRLGAAKKITSVAVQDRAFSVIALDAAASGHVELCLVALEMMTAVALQDEAAARASQLMSMVGEIDSGIKIAETIHSVALQDAVFAAIATGGNLDESR